ncbi:hypothetical protein KAJ83_10510 [Marivibrio halodurans]|uniref:Transferase hexapeptide (Six repeat-containing protein) n=1 Tax=Marivibrio halodurans TaxID=2039722 RepID=A0A8J7S040_9PROT|nr:hypothetical protein [Marivibrio halodurans]
MASRIVDVLSLPEEARHRLHRDGDSPRPGALQDAVDAAVGAGADRAIILLGHDVASDLANRLRAREIARVGYVDPSAWISAGVTLSETAVVMERAKIQSRVSVGPGVMIDALCAVAHGADLAAGAWIGPSATIGHGASIAAGARVETGATVAPNASIGAHATIGRATTATEAVLPGTRLQAPRSRPLPADAGRINTNLSISRYRPVTGDRTLSADEDLRHRRKYFEE